MSNDPSIFRFGPKDTVHSLLARNQAWAQRISGLRPALFPTLGEGQHPQILWIGCSDSRVPETTLLDLLPGEVFVHRNIANVVPPNDLSSLSVIQYAVEKLKVLHIVVCGHTCCGGVLAALGSEKLGLIDNWLKHIRDVRARHKAELNAIPDKNKRADRLAELNVIAQVHSVQRNANVQEAIAKRGLKVHGAIYNVGTGYIELVDVPEDPDADEYELN